MAKRVFDCVFGGLVIACPCMFVIGYLWTQHQVGVYKTIAYECDGVAREQRVQLETMMGTSKLYPSKNKYRESMGGEPSRKKRKKK